MAQLPATSTFGYQRGLLREAAKPPEAGPRSGRESAYALGLGEAERAKGEAVTDYYTSVKAAELAKTKEEHAAAIDMATRTMDAARAQNDRASLFGLAGSVMAGVGALDAWNRAQDRARQAELTRKTMLEGAELYRKAIEDSNAKQQEAIETVRASQKEGVAGSLDPSLDDFSWSPDRLEETLLENMGSGIVRAVK